MKNMKNIILKTLVAGVFVAGSQAAMAACPVSNSIFTNNVKPSFASSEKKVFNDLRAMNTAVGVASKAEVEAIASAVFVLTNQKALGTTQVIML